MQLLERIPGESSKSLVFRTIKENIINLNLEPGSQISENEIAAEVGLSRTPVREALVDLSKVKIVELFPQKRGIVSLIDYDLIDECQFMRKYVEKAVLEVVCKRAEPEDLKRLRENIRLQNFYQENFAPRKMMELDRQFHGILFEIAGKPLIYQVMNTVSIHLDRVRSLVLSSQKNLRSLHDHDDLLAAIEDRDVGRACAILEVHLTRYRADIAAIRENYPQYMK